jgi:L-amino acid N-acyltransferase YncA
MAISTDPISPAPEGFMSGLSDRSRRATPVRAASEADMAAVRDIYAHYVLHSLATFEETPPTLEEMLARRRASVELGLPYLVAEAEGQTLGFAYATAYRARPAYRFTVEDSVYVADGLGGRGIGSALLGELIAACERGPWRQMLAIVGDSANAGSIALHRRFGFELAGTLQSVGFKFGRWVDTPILQRTLAPASSE